MKQRKGRPQTADNRQPPLERADEIMREILTLNNEIERINHNANAEIQEVRDRHQIELSPFLQQLADLEGEIGMLMKEEKKEIFDGKDRIELRHGILLYLKGYKLSIPRKVAEKIIAQRWPIRIAISINKRAIESWPDQWLSDMGITKKPTESFSYELLPGDKKEDG